MKFNYFKTKIPFLGTLSLFFLLASCGSYEYVGYDTDGIYGPDYNRTVEYPTDQETVVEPDNDGTFYKNYFSEKAREYENVFDDNEIFTDVDSYEGDYNQEIDTLQYNKSYAGWGQNNSNVTINVIDNGWNSWGWYDPWVWNDPWMWNSWRWNRPWRYGPSYGWGWNNWGWNAGFGLGWYDPWGWNSGFGWGWNNWGWNNNYYGNYNRRGIAFNSSRRGSLLNRDLSSINRRSSTTSRLNSNSSIRSRNNSREYYNNRSTTPRRATRTTTPRSNSPRATSPRTSTPRASTPRSSTPRVSTPRSSSGGSSKSISRSSSSSSRSSGSSRSSSSSRSRSRG